MEIPSLRRFVISPAAVFRATVLSVNRRPGGALYHMQPEARHTGRVDSPVLRRSDGSSDQLHQSFIWPRHGRLPRAGVSGCLWPVGVSAVVGRSLPCRRRPAPPCRIDRPSAPFNRCRRDDTCCAGRRRPPLAAAPVADSCQGLFKGTATAAARTARSAARWCRAGTGQTRHDTGGTTQIRTKSSDHDSTVLIRPPYCLAALL